jgi:hypothetical protein
VKLKQPMAVEGLFEIARVPSRQPAESGCVILVCREGRLFGADPSGRVYTGVLHANAQEALPSSFLKAVYEVPRKGKHAPRHVPRHPQSPPAPFRAGRTVPISGEINPSARRQSATVLVGGKPIDIEITYLGPLPQ